jgi:hypothetical protein
MTGALVAASSAAASGLKPLTVTCDPSAVDGVWEAEFSVGVTGPCTAVPDGGLAPYAFVWSKVSGDTFSIIGATSQVASFGFSGPSHFSATYRVVTTDALGNTAQDTVSVTAN